MALITFLSQEELRNKIINKLVEQNPNFNTSEDSQLFMEADAIAEALFSIQVDAFSAAEESFVAFASGERLSNLGIERGLPRKLATQAVGEVTFSRAVLDVVNYPIPLGTEVSTQPDTEGNTVNFVTTSAATIYGQITPPSNLAGSSAISGGILLDSTDYYYVVTAVDGLGNETTISNEVVVSTGISGSDINSNTITWDAVTNAFSYNIYEGLTTGTETLLTSTTVAFYIHVSGAGNGSTFPPVTNNTGATSVIVPVQAKVAGANSNVPLGAISRLVDEPAGIEEVTNEESTAGGADEETDDEYRARMQDSFIFGTTQSKTTVTGYQQTALSVSGVATASVVNPNSGPNRNLFYIYITSTETNTGLPSPTLIATVQATVNSDDNRSPNDFITVLSPTPISVNATIQILTYDTDYDPVEVKAAVTSNIQDYINQLSSGEDVLVVGVANAVHDTAGVVDFNVIAPVTNISIANTEKAISGTITVI